MSEKTVSLEVAIEVVLRNGPTFETIAGLCKMAVEADRLAQRKPLTDEQIWEMDAYKMALTDQETRWLYRFARAIEAAHGIKE